MLTRSNIVELVKERTGPCVSLYMPTHQAPSDSKHDRVRFKNLLRAVKNDLISAESGSSSADDLLQCAEELRSDSAFWQQQSDGLACFAAPGFFLAKRLPIAVTPQYRLGKRFLVMPLLSLLNTAQRFFILSLEEQSARLLEATPDAIHEAFVLTAQQCVKADLPQAESASSRHASSPSDLQSVGAPLLLRWPSDEAHRQHSETISFLREVDRKLRASLRGEKTPLLLACVGFLANMYVGITSYSNLLPVKVPGSPSRWALEELHHRAQEIAGPFLHRERIKARSKFYSAYPNGLASADIARILLAAHDRRVETLLVAEHTGCQGHFHPERGTVSLDPSGENLLELAVGKTLLHEGEICVLERDQMPGQQAMAAVLRPK